MLLTETHTMGHPVQDLIDSVYWNLKNVFFILFIHLFVRIIGNRQRKRTNPECSKHGLTDWERDRPRLRVQTRFGQFVSRRRYIFPLLYAQVCSVKIIWIYSIYVLICERFVYDCVIVNILVIITLFEESLFAVLIRKSLTEPSPLGRDYGVRVYIILDYYFKFETDVKSFLLWESRYERNSVDNFAVELR